MCIRDSPHYTLGAAARPSHTHIRRGSSPPVRAAHHIETCSLTSTNTCCPVATAHACFTMGNASIARARTTSALSQRTSASRPDNARRQYTGPRMPAQFRWAAGLEGARRHACEPNDHKPGLRLHPNRTATETSHDHPRRVDPGRTRNKATTAVNGEHGTWTEGMLSLIHISEPTRP